MVPIVLFVYRRVHSARTLLEVLISGGGMDDHPLYIFSDAPKNDSERGEVEIVRQYIKDVSGFKELHIVEAVSHKGLARSVIEGVSMVLLEHDSVIVLEDDLIPQPGFMDYMCRALDFYKNDRLVFSISGFSFGFVPPQGYRHDVYALTRGCSWGWATWRDRWEAVDWNTRTYVDLLEDRAFWRSFQSWPSHVGVGSLPAQHGSLPWRPSRFKIERVYAICSINKQYAVRA